MHRAVVAGGWRDAGEGPRLAVECGHAAHRLVPPLAFDVGHEAHLVHPIAVVEAIHQHLAVLEAKARGHLHVDKWVSVAWPAQFNLEDVPAFN